MFIMQTNKLVKYITDLKDGKISVKEVPPEYRLFVVSALSAGKKES